MFKTKNNVRSVHFFIIASWMLSNACQAWVWKRSKQFGWSDFSSLTDRYCTSFFLTAFISVCVAQWIERLPTEQEVWSSILHTDWIFFLHFSDSAFVCLFYCTGRALLISPGLIQSSCSLSSPIRWETSARMRRVRTKTNGSESQSLIGPVDKVCSLFSSQGM